MPSLISARCRTGAIFAVVLFSQLVVQREAVSACNIVDGKAYGDCSNVRINPRSKGPLKVRGFVSESGIIDGATVFRGGDLTLSGVSNGGIVVHPGGALRASGIVSGRVTNQGGIVEIEGTADWVESNGGKVTIGGVVGGISGNGTFTIKKGAVIGGVPAEKTIRRSAPK